MRTAPRSIVLIGFMGTGKSVVGRELARILGREFVDVDEEIVLETGLAVKDIFARRGEEWFRRAEKAALAKACDRPGAVVAAGGGAPCDPDNLARMKEAGTVVLLRAGAESILDRLAGDGSRPLLAVSDRRAEVDRLLAEREPCYRQADLSIDTDGLVPGEVAGEIARRLGGEE